jgi:Tol biopolymer transport system component/DNA-binding winged helix-turn-helix (wHTH) protein
MSLETNRFEFEGFVLDAEEKVLLRNGKPLQVTPKVLHLLHVLIENHGHIVEKDDLMARVWPDSFVEESNLTFSVRQLRKILGDDDIRHPRFIETVPRRGYRFIADLSEEPQRGVSANGSNWALNGLQLAHLEKAGQATGVAPAGISSDIRLRPVFYSAVAVLLASLFLTGFFALGNRSSLFTRLWRTPSERSYEHLTLETLTDTGNTISADLSPDGKLLAYISVDAGKRSIWLRQLVTGKSVPVLPATEDTVMGISFSKDGQYLRYLHQPRDGALQLSRMSILGGAATKVLSGFHNGGSFSPDETRVAFVRMEKGESILMVSAADGGNERRLISYPRPMSIVSHSWSPDARQIAYAVTRMTSSGKESRLAKIDLETGAEHSVSDARWNYLETVMWLPDGTGFLACGRSEPGEADQIWFVSEEGRAEQITHDTSQLSLMGTSSDLSKIVLLRTHLDSAVSVADAGDPTSARPISKAIHDVSWTPDGRIVFPSRDTLKTDIWIANADGSNKRQLTTNDAVERSPVVSPDGRFVVFVSNQGGQQNIWRIDIDGNNPVQLTHGDGERNPSLSGDGKLVYFSAVSGGSLWQVPIDGGDAVLLLNERSFRAAVTPSGDKIAYFGREGDKGKLFVKTFPDLQPLHSFDAFFNSAATPKIVWSGDEGSLIYYRNDAADVGNLWRQPLVGGEPQKLTNFTSANIFDFSFSPDGSRLAIARGSWNHDAALLKGFR